MIGFYYVTETGFIITQCRYPLISPQIGRFYGRVYSLYHSINIIAYWGKWFSPSITAIYLQFAPPPPPPPPKKNVLFPELYQQYILGAYSEYFWGIWDFFLFF